MTYGTAKADNWAGGRRLRRATYSVGGTVSGLSGSVVLQDNGGDDLTVSANGPFAFATQLGAARLRGDGEDQPGRADLHGRERVGDGGSAQRDQRRGRLYGHPTYSVGGSVSGLSGTVVLQDNGGDDLSVTANGPFSVCDAACLMALPMR